MVVAKGVIQVWIDVAKGVIEFITLQPISHIYPGEIVIGADVPRIDLAYSEQTARIKALRTEYKRMDMTATTHVFSELGLSVNQVSGSLNALSKALANAEEAARPKTLRGRSYLIRGAKECVYCGNNECGSKNQDGYTQGCGAKKFR